MASSPQFGSGHSLRGGSDVGDSMQYPVVSFPSWYRSEATWTAGPCRQRPAKHPSERCRMGREASPMAMGNRPEVKTAPAPVVALDLGLLAQQLATAMARVPFRHPFAGNSSPASNLVISMTREVTRAFMGYSSALRIPEFRSLELMLDDICKVIMPPVVRSLDV